MAARTGAALLLAAGLLALATIASSNTEGDILYSQRRAWKDPNNVLQSWDPTLVNPCTWFHITCNNDNSVIRVDLGNADLSGTLVPELGQLQNLQYLYYTQTWIDEVPGRVAPHMDEEIAAERNKGFRRFFSGAELQKIKQQFANFSLFASGFNNFDSIEDRVYLDPKTWWGIHGNAAPDLRVLALKLLGQPSSSSCAERNWSTYGLIDSTTRNRLTPGRAEDLVFVHQNLRLLSRKSEEYTTGPSRFWDIGGDTHDVFAGGADFLQQAVLSLDEPELEALMDDVEALNIEAEDGEAGVDSAN